MHGVFGGLNAIEIKLINWKDGDTVDLSEIGLADNYVVSGNNLVSASAQSISINETTGTFLTPHPGGMYLFSTAPTDASQTASYSSTKIVVEDDNDLNVNTIQSTGGFFLDASRAGSGSKIDIVSMIAAEDIVITATNPIQFSAGSNKRFKHYCR